jgi:cytochrome o ubiquinol oxidase subunit 3
MSNITNTSNSENSAYEIHGAHGESESHVTEKNLFGFWIYIMSDCLLFASLFATFVILRESTYGSLTGKELFSMPFVLVETMILLTSSFTYGLAVLNAKDGKKNATLVLLGVTFLLGLAFIIMEIYEFVELIHEGATPHTNGFLSAFFTLVGTHGLHVSAGLFWMILLILQVKIHGITGETKGKLFTLGLFWHFLDVIWIFVFTIVYLMGAI